MRVSRTRLEFLTTEDLLTLSGNKEKYKDKSKASLVNLIYNNRTSLNALTPIQMRYLCDKEGISYGEDDDVCKLLIKYAPKSGRKPKRKALDTNGVIDQHQEDVDMSPDGSDHQDKEEIYQLVKRWIDIMGRRIAGISRKDFDSVNHQMCEIEKEVNQNHEFIKEVEQATSFLVDKFDLVNQELEEQKAKHVKDFEDTVSLEKHDEYAEFTQGKIEKLERK